MSSAIARSVVLAASGVVFIVFLGCSDAHKSSEFDQSSGKHETGWLPAGHSMAVVSDRAVDASVPSCVRCHGEDLDGGISGVSCSSCHLGGALAVHPADWQPAALNHKNLAANSTAACANQYCHGANLGGVAQSGPSCSSCHLGGPAHIHPEAWSTITRDHAAYASTAGTTGCANQSCHGPDLAGVQNSGPSCTSCHIGDSTHSHPATWIHIYKDHGSFVTENGTTGCANQACHGPVLTGVQNSGPSCTACHAIPFIQGSVVCTGCHQNPPDGTVFPNIAGKHAKHLALANVTCSTCHNGAGGSTVNLYHYNGTADEFFAATFNSKASVAAYDAASGKCSNVSCHGGPRTQTEQQASGLPVESTKTQTPDWLTGSIDAGTQCTSCHVYGTAEYNGYWSGQHRKHVFDKGKFCIDCHEYAKLTTNHFSTLNTSSLEGPASATLKSQLSFTITGDPPMKSCNPRAGG